MGYLMADGSLLLIHAAKQQAHALNADGAAIWSDRSRWTASELAEWLIGHGHAPRTAQSFAESFLASLSGAGVMRSHDRTST